MSIRATTPEDFDAFWPHFTSIIKAGDTYAINPDITQNEAYNLWCREPANSFVYEEEGEILGWYFIKANAMGPGDHVCNCGYMVSPNARGKGIATKLCEHSQRIGLELGFRAMQFNSVVSTNEVAVALWQKLGYQIIGTAPKAYRHKSKGYVDTHIMYKMLT